MQPIIIFLVCLSVAFLAIAVAYAYEFIKYRNEIKNDEIRDKRIDELLEVDAEDWASSNYPMHVQ